MQIEQAPISRVNEDNAIPDLRRAIQWIYRSFLVWKIYHQILFYLLSLL